VYQGERSRPAGRVHPFGRTANALAHGGASLGLIQSVVFVVGFGSSPFWGGMSAQDGGALLLVLALIVLLGGVTAWLCWRALRTWRDRDTAALGRLLVAGLVLLPLGALHPATLMYTPAGILLCAAAVTSRRRIVAVQRGEPADRAGRQDPATG
jgi:hypothetical protein